MRDRELEGGRTGGPGAHQLHRRRLMLGGAREVEAHDDLGAAGLGRADVGGVGDLGDQPEPEPEARAVDARGQAGALVAHGEADVVVEALGVDRSPLRATSRSR